MLMVSRYSGLVSDGWWGKARWQRECWMVVAGKVVCRESAGWWGQSRWQSRYRYMLNDGE